MNDIFISYASADRERAKLLSTALVNQGWSVWWDRTIPPGMEYAEVIEQALDSSTCVVVLWSTASVASSWVKTEAAEALQRRILVPALIDDTKIPLEFRRLQAADLSQWRGEASHPELQKFLKAVDAKLHGGDRPIPDGTPAVMPSPPPPPPPPPSPAASTPGQQTRVAWAAVALIGVLLAVAVVLLLVRSPGDELGPAVATQPQSAPATPAPNAVASAVDRADATSRPMEPAVAVNRPEPVGRKTEPPAPVVVSSVPVDRTVKSDADGAARPASSSRPPPARDANVAAPPGPAPVVAPPMSPPEPPVAPPAKDPPPGAPEPPVFAMQKFGEVLCVVTIDGEAEELDAVLVFGGTNLVVIDEDEKVLYTLPYRRVQKATYWKTQRRFVRTTRHWLNLGVGPEDILLVLPGNYELILSALEKRTGVTVTRRPG